MQLTDILAQMGGLQSIARELGVSEAQAAQGAQALAPAILGGMKRQVLGGGTGAGALGDLGASRGSGGLGGLGGLLGQLGQLGGGGLLDQVLSPQPTDVTAGNEVLGQIFGSREVSRTVAQNAAEQTGLDSSLLKKMLPMLAMLVAGYMARQGGQAGAADAPEGAAAGGLGDLGGLGGMLGGLLGGDASGGAARGAAGGQGGLGGLGSLLDLDGDGNPLDDILGMAGKALR